MVLLTVIPTSAVKGLTKYLMLLNNYISFLLSYLTTVIITITVDIYQYLDKTNKKPQKQKQQKQQQKQKQKQETKNKKQKTKTTIWQSTSNGNDRCCRCLEDLRSITRNTPAGTTTTLTVLKVSRDNVTTTEHNLRDNRSSCSRQEEERGEVLRKTGILASK